MVFAEFVRFSQEAPGIFHESRLVFEWSDGILGVCFGAVNSD
jgi:hypothetical protein